MNNIIQFGIVSYISYLFYCTFIKYIRIYPIGYIEKISEKVVLITGCDSGFGKELVFSASSLGFEIIAVCYTEAGAAEVNKEQRLRAYKKITTVVADLTDEDGRHSVVNTTMEIIKNRGLYSIVNNAGICISGNIDWLPTEVYQKTMDLNFFAPVVLIYRLLPELKKANGRVINVTSADGLTSLPSMSAYSSAINALESFSDSLRREMLDFNVKVVLIQPSITKTPFASSFADKWLTTFKNADESRTLNYGNSWAEKTHRKIKNNIQKVIVDEKDTVWDIMCALTVSNPPNRILSGYLSKIISILLNTIPDYVKDRLLNNIFFARRATRGAPPYDRISHFTIIVQNLDKSLEWYKKIGFIETGPRVNSSQFIKGGVYSPLLLLKEDALMVSRTQSDTSQLCIFTFDVKSMVNKLKNLDIYPVSSNKSSNGYDIVNYSDPDGFNVSFIEFSMSLYNIFARCIRFFYRISDPHMFHITFNISSYSKDYNALKLIGFTDLLFRDTCDEPALWPVVALVKLPKDKFVLTLVESKSNTHNKSEYSLPDTISISVKNVEKKIEKLKKYGLFCESVSLINYPIFGDVLVGKVYVNGNCIELCEYIGMSSYPQHSALH